MQMGRRINGLKKIFQQGSIYYKSLKPAVLDRKKKDWFNNLNRGPIGQDQYIFINKLNEKTKSLILLI